MKTCINISLGFTMTYYYNITCLIGLVSLLFLFFLTCGVSNFVARIRITKAAEFFKAVIPGMDPNMDKATAFHLTVYYMVFLRNALRQQDPPIIPKLHEVCVCSAMR